MLRHIFRLVCVSAVALLVACGRGAGDAAPDPAQQQAWATVIAGHTTGVVSRRSDIRVLSLPVGLRDGTSSLGDFNPQTQYYQTAHGKRLIGGYLSRLTRAQKEWHLRFPVLDALFTLSEDPWTEITPERRANALQARERFLTASHLAYVVTDDAHTTPLLRSFAEEVLQLDKVTSADGFTLYVPRVPHATTSNEAAPEARVPDRRP